MLFMSKYIHILKTVHFIKWSEIIINHKQARILKENTGMVLHRTVKAYIHICTQRNI